MSLAPSVVLAHDYITQCGGAERVALCLAEGFPAAPMYTTLYDPPRTFPEFASVDIRTGRLDRFGALRRNHRLALPLLAGSIDAQPVEGDVLLASSSGWAHGYRGAAHTVVYCHAPARWLYQGDRYVGRESTPTAASRARVLAARAALLGLGPRLRRWDQAAAARADLYIANSTVTQKAVRSIYGIDAEVLPPPPALLPGGNDRPVPGIDDPYLLCVARLLPYKNVDSVILAAQELGTPLVVVGEGPDRARLEALVKSGPSTARVHLLGRVSDDELRWLYRHCEMLVAASYEDFGLTPLEVGTFGRPSVTLGDGGYLDTVVDGETGVYFAAPTAASIAPAIELARSREWEPERITGHVRRFDKDQFIRRLHEVVRSVREPHPSPTSPESGHP